MVEQIKSGQIGCGRHREPQQFWLFEDVYKQAVNSGIQSLCCVL